MKKYLIIMTIFASNLFCISIPPMYPEFNVFGHLGASKFFTKTDVGLKRDNRDIYKWAQYKVYYDSIEGAYDLDAELTAQIGFHSKINDNFNINSLFEIGYSLYSIATKYESEIDYNIGAYSKHTDSVFLHCLVLGIIEKYTYKKFSVGLGAGVLIPISGKGISNMDNQYALVMPAKRTLNYKDIKKMFRVPFAPYIKLTLEYEVFTMKEQNLESSIVLGFYVNYNFGMKYDVSVLNAQLPRNDSGVGVIGVYKNGDVYNKYNFSNIDFGIVFGSSIKIYQ